ncbi:MAG: hypothetical protein Q9210_007210, partial [Variospora velana]
VSSPVIIFNHGLTGNRSSTWRDPKTGTIWPQDLLPDDRPKARIFTFGALLVSRGAAEPWMNALLESAAGIVFLGTPHSGSNLADWASILTKSSGLVGPTNKRLIDVLRPGSEMLANVQQEFHTMLDARQI